MHTQTPEFTIYQVNVCPFRYRLEPVNNKAKRHSSKSILTSRFHAKVFNSKLKSILSIQTQPSF